MGEQIPDTGSSWPLNFVLWVLSIYITCFTSPCWRHSIEAYPTFL